MKIEIHLLHQSQPVVRHDVRNSYEKGSLFCIMLNSGEVEKYPIEHIFRVVETQDDYPIEAEQDPDVECEPVEDSPKKVPFETIEQWRNWMDEFYGKKPYRQTFDMNPKFDYDWVLREQDPVVKVVDGLGINDD